MSSLEMYMTVEKAFLPMTTASVPTLAVIAMATGTIEDMAILAGTWNLSSDNCRLATTNT